MILEDRSMCDLRYTIYEGRFTIYDIRGTIYDVSIYQFENVSIYDIRGTIYDIRCVNVAM